MTIRWNAAQVFTGMERAVQIQIEDTDRAAFVPTHVRGWFVGKHKRFREHPLLPGYVLFATAAGDTGFSEFTHNAYGERTASVLGSVADEGTVAELMLAHATGRYNAIQSRDNGGRYKGRRRRPRPRPGKRQRLTLA